MTANPLPLPPAEAAAAPWSAPGADQAAELLAAAPVALLHVAPDGRLQWANAAALALLGPAATPGQALSALWETGAEVPELLGALPAAADLPLQRPTAMARWVQASSRPLPQGGALLALQAVDERRAAAAEVQRLGELLDLARDFGRLGVWERNLRTMEGHWDAQVHRYWGSDPALPAPKLTDAAQRIVEADRAGLDRTFRQSMQQPGRYSTRYRVRGADGKLHRIHSQWLVKAGADGQPEKALGLMMDDSEPFRLALTNNELESQLALAVDLGDIAIWRHEFDRRRVHLNDQGWRILGLPARADGLAIDEIRALVHTDDRAAVVQSAREALHSGHPADQELRYRRSDGQWRTVLTRRVLQRDAAGRAAGFIGVGLDVTGRHTAAMALRSASERAALAARGAGLGTWDLDMVTGETHWDEQMWRLRGHAPRAHPMDDAERMACVYPDDRPGIDALFRPAIAEGRPYDHHFRIVRPDGQVRWLASRSVELRDEITGSRLRIGVNWDITDRRTAEIVRAERETALRESESKSRFLARMSHELRTPLNAVLGFSQLLLADDDGGGDTAAARRRWLVHVRSAGQHLLGLIDDVLDLTRLEGGEAPITLQPASLAPLVAQTLPLLGPLGGGRPVTVHTGPLDVEVLADAARLRQALLNVLTHAVEHNREGVEITIDAAPRDGGVVLRVADSGRGLTGEQLRHLFEPFNRLGGEGDAAAGSGVGLAIVKVLVERMGGTVHVESTVGRGSVFELRLLAARSAATGSGRGDAAGGPHPAADPASAPPAQGAPRAASEAAAATQPRRSVLYIEDNAVNALIIRELLATRPDLELHVAVDGASGVAQAAALLPALVLLDMQLPDCDGFEVLRRLRAVPATAGIPCVALSANAMSEDIERTLQAGVVDYWTKPLDFPAFMASLDALLGNAP